MRGRLLIMVKVVDIQAYRAKTLKERVFGPWQKRFDESFAIDIKLSELSDKTLYYLAQPGDNRGFCQRVLKV